MSLENNRALFENSSGSTGSALNTRSMERCCSVASIFGLDRVLQAIGLSDQALRSYLIRECVFHVSVSFSIVIPKNDQHNSPHRMYKRSCVPI